MSNAIGGVNVFPSLEDIMRLFRSRINDDMSGQSGTPGEGQIATDAAPFALPFMNSAFEELYSDLRIVNDQELIFDNFIVEGLPVVNGPYGVGAPAPETQVYLGINGFFDGTTMHSQYKLPIYTRNVTRMWERTNGSGNIFTPMAEASFGLSPALQTDSFGCWEYRQNAVWMPGALVTRDVRVRGTMAFTDFIGNSSTINFATTFFPITDSKRAVVYNMLTQYADRFAPEQAPVMEARYDKAVGKLRAEIVLRGQTKENSRGGFADVGDGFGLLAQL